VSLEIVAALTLWLRAISSSPLGALLDAPALQRFGEQACLLQVTSNDEQFTGLLKNSTIGLMI
jgi:hypothetical protein